MALFRRTFTNSKNVVKYGLGMLFRILPFPLWRMLFLQWCSSIAEQEPRTAMRTMITLHDDLLSLIDRVAVRYDQGIHVKHRLTRYHDFFVERIRPGEQVLDIGCGYGAVAYSIATRANALVTGIDMNAEHIAQAQQRYRHPGLTFICGKAPHDLPEKQFETIVLSNVLEHIEHRVAFLTTVQQRIRPERWLIRVPMINRHWLVPMRQELGMFAFSDPTHYTEYTRQSFEDEMGQAGFAIVHLQINWGEVWAEVAPKQQIGGF